MFIIFVFHVNYRFFVILRTLSATIKNVLIKLKERTVVCCAMYSVKERNMKTIVALHLCILCSSVSIIFYINYIDYKTFYFLLHVLLVMS